MVDPDAPQPARTTPDPAEDPVEQLLTSCLDRPEGEWSAAVDEACDAHPALAAALRRRFERLHRSGLGTPGGIGPDAVPERLGSFRLLERLGGGGMGVVYRARDESLGREVALKLIRPEHLYFPGARERFRREVETVAKFQHPGIVPVYSVGEQDGVPFFAMECVRGLSLAELIAALQDRQPARLGGADVARVLEKRLGRDGRVADPRGVFGATWVEFCLRAARQVAEALAHAHGHDVLHRDVKPSNTLITADGRVRLVDFGLSVSSDTSRMTRSGGAVGSLPYMAPEQLAGRALDQRTDVYGLGVTLYELLTLQAAFPHDDADALRRAILTAEIVPPRQRNAAIAWDAETVCLVAMERDPARRYASSAELATDLGNVLMRRPILGRRPGAVLRARRFVQRHPTASTAAVLGFLVVVVGPLAALWQERQSNVELRAALERVEQLADELVLQELRKGDDELWPAVPDNVPAFERWLAGADALLARAPLHRQALAELRQRALPYSPDDVEQDRQTRAAHAAWAAELRKARDLARVEAATDGDQHWIEDIEARLRVAEARIAERYTWRFAQTTDQWRHGMLARLCDGLDGLPALRERIAERARFARELPQRTLDDHRERWAAVAAEIARSSVYRGLALLPQLGLVPLGADPASGLHEFAHFGSGTVPARDPASGRLQLDDGSAIVLVLVPGGTYRLGASATDRGGGQHDPFALEFEGPVHGVELDPFFIGKHEVSQGQWERLTGTNPSGFKPGQALLGDIVVTRRFPVDSVSRTECVTQLGRHGLVLPTEAQWESACRAGTSTVWWWGDLPNGFDGCANLCDRTVVEAGVRVTAWEEDVRDGYVHAAPIDAFRPNPFGLHNTIGNAAEWCRDAFTRYDTVLPRPGDGLRDVLHDEGQVVRGGHWGSAARSVRSAARFHADGETRDPSTGVRAARLLDR